MSSKEREQLVVFEQLKNGQIKQVEAALKLGVSARWIREKYKRYKLKGARGLVHGRRGKPSGRRWKEEERERMLELLGSDWAGFGPTLVAEKLAEREHVDVSRETVRQEMIKAGIWRGKKRKSKHRKRRERKEMLGLMVQLDGSPHDWLEGRSKPCTLLVFIDDATSRLLWLEFVTSESCTAVIGATKDYITLHGRPHAFYTDHGSVFSVNLNNPERDKLTQWERAVQELGIRVIHAHSPQAKGRVERANGTLQNRLVKELRLAGASSIDEANQFLRTSNFIAKHNERFAVPPTREGDAHRSIGQHDLATIFTIREERTLANDYTITYQKRIFQLDGKQPTIIRPKDKITVNTQLDGAITLSIRNSPLTFMELSQRPEKPTAPRRVRNQAYQKPGVNSQRWVRGLQPLYLLQNTPSPESRVKTAPPAVEAPQNGNF